MVFLVDNVASFSPLPAESCGGDVVGQWYSTLAIPKDWSPPGSSVHGIFQARILQWVAISFSRASSWPGDRTRVSCIAGGSFTNWATRSEDYEEAILTAWAGLLFGGLRCGPSTPCFPPCSLVVFSQLLSASAPDSVFRGLLRQRPGVVAGYLSAQAGRAVSVCPFFSPAHLSARPILPFCNAHHLWP